MSSSLQTGSSLPSSRSTGFVPVDEAISPEVRIFGAIFLVLWMLLLVSIFVTRRKQLALRGEVGRLEAILDSQLDDGS
jgi:hypothetical protein